MFLLGSPELGPSGRVDILARPELGGPFRLPSGHHEPGRGTVGMDVEPRGMEMGSVGLIGTARWFRRTSRATLAGLGLLAASSAAGACTPAPSFTVTSTVDAVDVTPGDGVCEATTGAGDCTLRAAVMEANLAGTDASIHLPPGGLFTLAIPRAHNGQSYVEDSSGDLDITGSITLYGAGATIDGGGIDRVLRVAGGGGLLLKDTTVRGGVAKVGGGIRIDPGGYGTISRSTITGNTATGRTTCLFTALYSSGQGCGNETSGAAFSSGEGGGGGISNRGTLLMGDSTVSLNVLSYHGPCGPWVNRLFHCTYARGAGILNYSVATILNSTISGNQAPNGDGGGIATDWYNASPEPVTTLRSVTIAGNSAGGSSLATVRPYLIGTAVHGPATIDGVVIDGTGLLCGTSLTSRGFNVIRDASCLGSGALPTDAPSVDPLLGPLASNGGLTATHLPAAGSPVIDRVPATSDPCALIITDQRGVARPTGPACDSGSVER